jgi:hypothetical protein
MVAALHMQRNHWGSPLARGRRVVGLNGGAHGLPALGPGRPAGAPPAQVDVLDPLTDPISKPVQAAMWVRASQVWTPNGSGSLHRLGWFGPKRCWRGAADSVRPSDPRLGKRMLLTCLTPSEEG